MKFSGIDFSDPFFDSFRADYHDFDEWSARKRDEEAVAAFSGKAISGFLYLKAEEGPIYDVRPAIPHAALKIGSFKAKNAIMGHCFVNLAEERARREDIDIIYITFYPHHKKLRDFLERRGFFRHGRKGGEEVWARWRGRISVLAMINLFLPSGRQAAAAF